MRNATPNTSGGPTKSVVQLRPNGKDARYWILELVKTKDKKGKEKLDWIMSKAFTPAPKQIAVVHLAPGQSLHAENCRISYP